MITKEELLKALEQLIEALDDYEEFRETNTQLPDEYWHSMNKD